MSKKEIYRALCLACFALLIPLALSAKDNSGWRTPGQSELKDDLGWRKEDPNRYLVVRADFDGDGKQDVARLLINDKDNKMGLFVKLSSLLDKKEIKLEEFDDKSWIEVMGISVVKPGNYRTACGKGYFECKKGEPETLSLKRPAIDFFKFGSANSFFFWDGKSKRFRKIWMSD
jgi:hypothetical protein